MTAMTPLTTEEEEEEQNAGLSIDDVISATINEAEDEEFDELPIAGISRKNAIRGNLPIDIITRATNQLGIRQICAHCRKHGEIPLLCICSDCGGRPYHKTCWPDAVTHQPSDGYEICKPWTEFAEYIWVRWLFYSKTSPEKQASLHRDDIWSTWFAVPYEVEAIEKPSLYLYPRLNYLIGQAQTMRDDGLTLRQYPSLVSFFGDTGGGKSTLIKALIYNAALNTDEEVPVPGNNADRHVSTSGDIHLYSDPKTIDTSVPLFYAGKSRVSLSVN